MEDGGGGDYGALGGEVVEGTGDLFPEGGPRVFQDDADADVATDAGVRR